MKVLELVSDCIICGKPISESRLKTGKARYCSQLCVSQAWKHRQVIRVNEEDREFIGWFCGDGYARISKNYPTKKLPAYTPVLGATIRDDDKQILIWAKERYGGMIVQNSYRKIINVNTEKKYIQNPTITWVLSSLEGCENLLKIMLTAKIPSKKIEELKLVYEFVKLKLDFRRKHTPRIKQYPQEMLDKFEDLYIKVTNLKKYHE